MKKFDPKFTTGSLFICSKCGQGFNAPEQAEKLKSELRSDLKKINAHTKVRVMVSGCLGICEPDQQTFAYYPNSGNAEIYTSDKDFNTSKNNILQFIENVIIKPAPKTVPQAQFNLSHFFYYFGGLVCILAMTWFMNLGWEQFGGKGITLISAVYMLIFTALGQKLWNDSDFKIPAGILLTCAVCMTPLLVFGLQKWLNYWNYGGDPADYHSYHELFSGRWMLMSISTVLVGFIYLKKFPFTFLTMPISIALFYIMMEIVPFIYGEDYGYELRKMYSVCFGIGMIIVSYILDRAKKIDYSFWLYLFGVISFWGGLTLMKSDNELNKFIYFCINLILLFLSLFLYRYVFMVFGAIGVMGYFWHLADKVFAHSILFPFVMTAVGLAIMYLGITYQKNKKIIDQKFSDLLPQKMKDLRPIKK